MKKTYARMTAGALALGALTALPAPAAARSTDITTNPVVWQLDKRALLSADYIAPGPPSGAAITTATNGRVGPFPGQVIPGFSGLLDNGDGTFWAMPDNGFGAKGNSADFYLRLYKVTPKWQTANGGAGEIVVNEFISLRDPNRKLPFAIVNESSSDRLLTGADFDIESVVQMRDGSFWIGEEFGPFLIHVDKSGKVLSAPFDFIGGKSPQHPRLGAETPVVPRSRGFEAMAKSKNDKFLYPIVEGALTTDTELRRRWIYEFDVKRERYTGRRWAYRTDGDPYVIGDAVMLDDSRLMLIERDDFEGPRSVTKKLYTIDLRSMDADGFLNKHLAADLLLIQNPKGIGANRPAGGYGVGHPFSFALQSVESLVVMKDGRLLIANDNNYPFSNGRVAGSPDNTEMIVLSRSREGNDTLHGKGEKRLVIGHRGASGHRPEHTLAAYELAIRQCADFIEPDLVSTKDGVLVARHENEIGGTTDIALRPEFASRKSTKLIDGVSVTGWFTEDLTLAELKSLRAIERIPAIRPANTGFDRLLDVPTLQEVITLAKRSVTCDGNVVGIYPETKHPSYFDSIGLSLEEPLLATLKANGYDDDDDRVYIQSFETATIRELSRITSLPLVQLISCAGRPWDFTVAGDTRTYADLASAVGLKEIATYADGVGVCKDVMIPRDATANLLAPSPVIANAHEVGLEVHGWTFRAENPFLPANLRSSAVPTEYGNLNAELAAFLGAGMDGFFTDQPDRGVIGVAPFE